MRQTFKIHNGLGVEICHSVYIPLRLLACCMGVPGFEFLLYFQSSLLLMHTLGKEWNMYQSLVSLTPILDIWNEF